MRKWIFNGLLLPLLFLLSGCKNAYLKELILIDDTCQPPCWSNIDPRKTTTSDVVVLIQKNPQLDQKKITYYDCTWQNYEVKTIFLNENEINLYSINNHVEIIEFPYSRTGLLATNGFWNINVEEAIIKYGNPDYINLARYGDDGFEIIAVYKTQGVIWESYIGGLHLGYPNFVDFLTNKINDTTKISRIIYFNPDNFSDLEKTGMNSYYGIDYAWKGYGNLDNIYPLGK